MTVAELYPCVSMWNGLYVYMSAVTLITLFDEISTIVMFESYSQGKGTQWSGWVKCITYYIQAVIYQYSQVQNSKLK